MEHTSRFDGKGNLYAEARPDYAAELLEYLRRTLHPAAGCTFADIGSGTGIFTKQLLRCGYRVFAVEPNSDMRRVAEEKLSSDRNFISVNGCAERMNLPDGAIDFITAAQAFHWFQPDAFRLECKRVLKPGGKVILVYNHRIEDAGCTKALAKLRQRYNKEFHGFSNGINSEACIAFFAKGCDIFRADHTQTYDRNGYIKRVLSSSYSLSEADIRYADYRKEINKIFDTFSSEGRIAIPAETTAYIGEV